MIRSSATRVAAVSVLAACLINCSNTSDGTPPNACSGVAIDRFKELEIVDDAVVGDARSLNGQGGAWSFRHLFEQMIPSSANPSDFVVNWLNAWVNTAEVNGFPLDRESRAQGMHDALLCPWLHATASNQCDDSCSNCAANVIDLAKAPFRLTAITNRLDLGYRPGIQSKLGELRFVFALTRGPADDPASAPAPLSLAMEFAVPEAAYTQETWAERWHKLGTYAAFDEEFRNELQAITDPVTARGAAPSAVNGSAIAQVRTNESAFNWIWQLRQFNLDPSGQLTSAAVVNTPGESLNQSSVLRDFVLANRDAVLNDKHVVPYGLLAGSANEFLFRWAIPDVDDQLRTAFAKSTCNGCHAGENPSVDTAFHVSPFRSGVARLSPFVNNPGDSTHDELARRETVMRGALCGQ